MALSAQYGQPDAQQWAQYAAQPQQQYAEQQPDYSYYYQQQAQSQGLSQPYPPQATSDSRTCLPVLHAEDRCACPPPLHL